MPAQIIQIALVDDHKLFRSGIASLIGQFKGYKIIFEAAHGLELIEKITAKLKPNIVLLDIKMPEMDGFTTTEWLKRHHPNIKIIILSMFHDADKVLAMVKLGVQGYLLKVAEPEEFEEALKTVAAGEIFYPSFVTKHLAADFNKHAKRLKFSSRELEFLSLTCTEFTYKEIAEHMCVSVRTVNGYRDQLFDKLHLKTRVGLALYAVKNNLIKL